MVERIIVGRPNYVFRQNAIRRGEETFKESSVARRVHEELVVGQDEPQSTFDR